MPASTILQAIARAYFAREQARLGITEQRAAARLAGSADLVRQAQLARALQEMGMAPEEHELKTRLTEAQIRNLDEPNRAAAGTPHYERDEAGNVTAVVPQPDGTFKTMPVGKIGAPQREPAERQPPQGRLSPVTDSTGRIVGTFNNVTGEVSPVAGGKPGEPAALGGVNVRRSGVPAGEMEKRGILTSMLSDLNELETLAEGQEGNIGPLAGRFAAARRATVGVGPDTNDMFHIADNLADQLLRARSGAQINEQEYRRLRLLTPNPRTPSEKFWADLRRFKIELQNILSARQGGPVDQRPETGVAAPRTAAPAAAADPDPLGILDGGR